MEIGFEKWGSGRGVVSKIDPSDFFINRELICLFKYVEFSI